MVDYTIDQYEKIETPINRYAKTWGWSRNKVRKFIEDINSPKGHQKDTKRTLQGHSVSFINKGLRKQKDTSGTVDGQAKGSNNKFIKPTAEELRAYAKEIGYNLDVEQFLDSYESKGWLVGKNKVKMKSWKATVRTWQREKWGEDRRRTLAL
jgi:hypothetical protein